MSTRGTLVYWWIGENAFHFHLYDETIGDRRNPKNGMYFDPWLEIEICQRYKDGSIKWNRILYNKPVSFKAAWFIMKIDKIMTKIYKILANKRKRKSHGEI